MLLEILGTRVREQEGPSFDAERLRRVALAASNLSGLAIARHIIKLPPIAEMDHDTLVAEVAPTLQHYLFVEEE